MPLKSGFYKIAHTESGVRRYLYSAALHSSYEYRFSIQIGGTEAIQGIDANSTIYYVEVESDGLRIFAPRFNAEIRSNTSDNPINWVTWEFWKINNGSDRWELANETTVNGHVAGFLQIKGRSSEWGRLGFPASYEVHAQANLGKYSDTRWLLEFEPFIVEPGLPEGFYRFKNASTNKRLGNPGVHTYEQSDSGLLFKASWCGAEYGSAAMRLINFETGETDLVTSVYSGINGGASVNSWSPENGIDGGSQVNHLWHYAEGKIGTSGSPAPSQIPSSISWPSYGAPFDYLGSVSTAANGIRMGRFTDGNKTEWIAESFDKTDQFADGDYRLYNAALGGYLTNAGTFSANKSDAATITISNHRTDSRYGSLVDIDGLPASNVLTDGAWVAGTEAVDTSKGFHITHLTTWNDAADTDTTGIIWLGDWSDTVGLACGVSNDSQPVYGYAQKTFETFKKFLAPEISGTTVEPALDKSDFTFEPIRTKVELTGEYQFAVDGTDSGITDGTEYGFDADDVVYIKGIKSVIPHDVSLGGTHIASYLSTLTIDASTMSFRYIDDGETYYLASNSDKTVSTSLTPDETDTWSIYNVGYGTKKIDGQNRDGVAIYSDKQKAYLAFANGTWVLQSDPVCFWPIDITKRGSIESGLNVSIKQDFPISITPYLYDQQRIKYLWNDSTNKSAAKLKAKSSPFDPISYKINLIDSPDWAMADGVALRQSIDNGLYLGDENGSAVFYSSINEKTILELKISYVLAGGGSTQAEHYAAYITKPHSNICLQYYGIGQPYFAKYGRDDANAWFMIRYEIDQRTKIELNGNYAIVSAASPSGSPCIVNTKNRKTSPDETYLIGQPLTIRNLGSFDGATDFWALNGLGNGVSMICSPFVFDSIKWTLETDGESRSFWSYKTNASGAAYGQHGIVIHYEKKDADGKPLYSIRPWSDLSAAATIAGSGAVADGQQIIVQEYTGSDRQLWHFRKSEQLSHFPYRFRSFLDTASIFGITGNSVSYGSIINNTSQNATDNSTRIIPATIKDSTKNRFVFAHSGENIDDLGHGTEENGANVCQWGIDPNDQGNQTWEYIPMASSDVEIGGYKYPSARIFNWRSGNARKLIDPSAGGTSVANIPLMWASRSDTDANKQAQYIVATPDCLYDATMPVASNIALVDDSGTIHDEQTISAPDMTWGVAFNSDDYNTGWSIAAEYRDVMNNGTAGEWMPIEIQSYVETLGQDTYKEPKWGMAWSANVSPNISDNRIIADTNFKIGGKDVGTGNIIYIVAKQLRISVRSIAPSTTLTLRSYNSDKQYFDYIPTCGNTASKIFTILSDPSINFRYFEAGANGLKIGYDSINIPSGFSLSITSILTKSGDIKVHASEYNLPTNGTIAIDWNDLEDTIPFADDWPNNEITGFTYKIEYEGITAERDFYLGVSKFVLSAHTHTSSIKQIELKADPHSLSAHLFDDKGHPISGTTGGTTPPPAIKYIVGVKYVYRVKFADRNRLVTNFGGIVSPQRTQNPDSGIWAPSNIEPERAMCFIFFNTGEINVIEPPTAGELIAPPRIGVSVFDFIDEDGEYHELHLIGNVGYTDAIDLDASEVHGSGSQFSEVYYGGGSTHQVQINGVIGINQPLTSDTFEANTDGLNRLLYSKLAIYRTPFGGWHAVKVTGIEYGRDAARYSKVTVKMTEIDPDEISD